MGPCRAFYSFRSRALLNANLGLGGCSREVVGYLAHLLAAETTLHDARY